MTEFWEVAGPLTRLSAREITYGDKNRLIVFQAAVQKIGHPVEAPGCLICIKDGLIHLRNAYKQFTLMESKKEQSRYILNRDLFYDGVRITNENITDEIAAEILANNPALKFAFSYIPAVEEPAPVEVVEDQPEQVEQPAKRSKAKKEAE